jgi:hypothetical protein
LQHGAFLKTSGLVLQQAKDFAAMRKKNSQTVAKFAALAMILQKICRKRGLT